MPALENNSLNNNSVLNPARADAPTVNEVNVFELALNDAGNIPLENLISDHFGLDILQSPDGEIIRGGQDDIPELESVFDAANASETTIADEILNLQQPQQDALRALGLDGSNEALLTLPDGSIVVSGLIISPDGSIQGNFNSDDPNLRNLGVPQLGEGDTSIAGVPAEEDGQMMTAVVITIYDFASQTATRIIGSFEDGEFVEKERIEADLEHAIENGWMTDPFNVDREGNRRDGQNGDGVASFLEEFFEEQ